jgi:ArsR family transcriptional regulator
MNHHLREEMDRLHAQVCSALSDPSRILILYLLEEKSQNVTELMNNLELSQPSVSRHLKVLRERNMVTSTRDGQTIVYSLRDQRVIQALDLLREMMADTLQSQADLARRAQTNQP